MTDFASIYETNVFTIKQDHLSTNSIHVSTCQWRRKQVESEWGGGAIRNLDKHKEGFRVWLCLTFAKKWYMYQCNFCRDSENKKSLEREGSSLSAFKFLIC